MPQDRMTPRERWVTVINRKVPDRIPLDYGATAEATQKVMKYLGVDSFDDLMARLHVEPKAWVGGRYTGPATPEGVDIFGCRYANVDYGTGVYAECVHYPLANYTSVEEIEANYSWPNPDWWDYTHLPEEVKGKEHLPILGGGSEPFLIYKNLRGMEQAYMDLVLNPEIVHYCLDRLFHLAYENTRRIYETIPGKVLISYVAEDLGSQESLIISLAQIHEFLLPRMKRIMDLVHDGGGYVFHHNDGAIRPLIPDMITAGMDVLNPVQWRCRGMDREGLKRDFGSRIAFHAGVDNQYTLAFGTVDEVRREVVENIRILGAGGGYILAPCHNIQAVSPPENIVAMYDTAWENGWY
jgi:uroporphyrinogen decarboxylase